MNKPGTPVEPNKELVIYSGQHKSATLALYEAFTEQTGIQIQARGHTSNVSALHIVEQCERSPADIIYTEDSTPLFMLANKQLLAKINDAALGNIPAEYRDKDGNW